MSMTIGSIADFSRRKPRAFFSGDVYRSLGVLDHALRTSPHQEALGNLLTAMDVWANLSLDFPDTPPSHLSMAGERLAFFQQEVRAYVERIGETLRLPLDMHRDGLTRFYHQMTGGQGGLRTTDLWIGGTSLATAQYGAPKAEDLSTFLEGLLAEAVQGGGDSPLENLGVLHQYAFLLLPFPRDNALWIRLWTARVSHSWQIPKVLSLPLSVGLVREKSSYAQDLLGDLSTTEPLWIRRWERICSVSIAAALEAQEGYHALWHRLERARDDFGRSFLHLQKLLPRLAKEPHITLTQIGEITGLTKPNARILLERCEKTGLLSKVTFDARGKIYVCAPLLRLITQS